MYIYYNSVYIVLWIRDKLLLSLWFKALACRSDIPFLDCLTSSAPAQPYTSGVLVLEEQEKGMHALGHGQESNLEDWAVLGL